MTRKGNSTQSGKTYRKDGVKVNKESNESIWNNARSERAFRS